MNILLFGAEELSSEGTVRLSDRRFLHLCRVLHAEPGLVVRAGVVRGQIGTAKVIAVNSDSVDLQFLPEHFPQPPSLDLVLALPRPKAMSRMVQAASSFGSRRIDIINAWRVDASYFKSHKIDPAVLTLDAHLGCEQGRLTYVPEVSVHRFFAEFLEGVLAPQLRQEPDRRLFIGHPTEPGFPSAGIEVEYPRGASVPVTLVIGPDGGFIARELESLLAIGGRLVHFGDAVLRSENAMVAGLAQLDLLRRLC